MRGGVQHRHGEGSSVQRSTTGTGTGTGTGNGASATAHITRRSVATSRHHHPRHPAQEYFAQLCSAKKVKQTSALVELLGLGVVWAEIDDMGMEQLEVLRSLVENSAHIALTEIHLACGLKSSSRSNTTTATKRRTGAATAAAKASTAKSNNRPSSQKNRTRTRLGLPPPNIPLGDKGRERESQALLLSLCRALRAGLSSSTLLTRLELIGTYLSVADARVLASGVRMSSSLRFVSVQGSRCGDAAFVSLAAAIGDNHNVNDACFNGCALSDASRVHITGMLRKHAQRRDGERWAHTLRDVSKSGQAVLGRGGTLDDTTTTGETSVQLHGLMVLDLSQNQLGDLSANDIAHALRFDDWVAAINLRGNRMTADGARSLLHLVQGSNSHLVCLDLRNNDPSAAIVVAQVDRCMKEANATEQRLQPGRQSPEAIEVIATTLFRWESGHQLDPATRDAVAGVTGHMNSLGMSTLGRSGVGLAMSGRRGKSAAAGTDHDTKAALMSSSFRRWVTGEKRDDYRHDRGGGGAGHNGVRLGVRDVAKWPMGDAPRAMSGFVLDTDDDRRRAHMSKNAMTAKMNRPEAKRRSTTSSATGMSRTRTKKSGKEMAVLRRAHAAATSGSRGGGSSGRGRGVGNAGDRADKDEGGDEEEEENEWAGYSRDDLDAFADELLALEGHYGQNHTDDDDDDDIGRSVLDNKLDGQRQTREWHQHHKGGSADGPDREEDPLRQSRGSMGSTGSRSDATRFLVTFKHELKVAMADAATKTHNNRVAAVLRQTVDTLDSLMPTEKLLELTDRDPTVTAAVAAAGRDGSMRVQYHRNSDSSASNPKGSGARENAKGISSRRSRRARDKRSGGGGELRQMRTHDSGHDGKLAPVLLATTAKTDVSARRPRNRKMGGGGGGDVVDSGARDRTRVRTPHAGSDIVSHDDGSCCSTRSGSRSSAADHDDEDDDDDRSLCRNFLDLDLHEPVVTSSADGQKRASRASRAGGRGGGGYRHHAPSANGRAPVDVRGSSARVNANGVPSPMAIGTSNPAEYQDHVNEIASKVSDRLRSLWNMA